MKKFIIGVIFGILLSGSIIYAKEKWDAKDILFNENDVETELNNLYKVNNDLIKTSEKLTAIENELKTIKSKGNAINSDIAQGKTAVVNGEEIVGTLKKHNFIKLTSLGSTNVKATEKSKSLTVDIKLYKTNYQDFTADNFFISCSYFYGNTSTSSTWADTTASITKSYNPSTGILTVKIAYGSSVGGYQIEVSPLDIYLFE